MRHLARQHTSFAEAFPLQTTTRMRIARLTAVLGFSLLGACTTGNNAPDPTGRLCSTHYTVSGTFMQSTARPADNQDGCWPVGTWTFSVAVDTTQDNTCNPAPTPLPMYQMEADWVADPNDPGQMVETFKYDTDPSVLNHVSVTEGGVIMGGNGSGFGACAGELDLWDAACTHVWTLQPEADTYDPGGTIQGQGEYSEYGSMHCPYDTAP